MDLDESTVTATDAFPATTTPELETAPPLASNGLSHWYDSVTTWLAYLWHLLAPYVTTPVLLLFVLPLVMFLCIYCSGVVLYFYQKGERVVRRLREAYEDHDIYRASREIIATCWDMMSLSTHIHRCTVAFTGTSFDWLLRIVVEDGSTHTRGTIIKCLGHLENAKKKGWIWFGYEIDGLENIPTDGPAMVLYYHGALPVDYYFFVAKVIQHKGRVMHSVVDRFLFRLWGLNTFLKAFYCTPGSQESCTEELKKGHIIGLSPGGVYEAQFGDSRYEIMWKDRVGFAKIALRTGCPVIPMFTVNVREAFRTLQIFKGTFLKLYKKTRLPLMPIYGGLPVKLHTFIGEPISYDPENTTPEQLRDLCRDALEALIQEHQKRPGSIARALKERFCFLESCRRSNRHRHRHSE